MQKWENENKTTTFTMTEHMFTLDTSNITNILPTSNLTSTTFLVISDPIFELNKDLKQNMTLRKPMVPLIEIDIKFAVFIFDKLSSISTRLKSLALDCKNVAK